METRVDDARDILEQRGVIPVLTKIVSEVYARNAARYDPVLGDDPTTFGITTSRNIANLAVQRLDRLPGIRARLVDTALEILCDGYILRQYKLPGESRDISVNAISWDDSEAKLIGAIENSTRQLTLDADLEAGVTAFSGVVPTMRHLRLVHAGDLDTGECVIYLGFPRDDRDGGSPWYDVALIHGDPGEQGQPGGGPAGPRDAGPPPGPRYDELPLPEFDLGRRRPHREPGHADART